MKKRDGQIVDFDIAKIIEAIKGAFKELEKQYDDKVIDMLALRATADFELKVNEGLIGIEDIQDSVEKVLSDSGYTDVAKAYILYRQRHTDARTNWIRVSDEPPKSRQQVLVTADYNGKRLCMPGIYINDVPGKDPTWIGLAEGEPIAWMPKPEPFMADA